jgi:polar amino acid transport system substrate-binding protein
MNPTQKTLVGLAALAASVVGCNLDKEPTAPRAPIRADQVAVAGAGFACDVGGASWEGDPDAAVLHDLAPSGVMRVAFNYNNRNNAARNPITGALTGPGIDMSCKLAEGTHVQFAAIAYLGVPPLLTGLANGDWDVAFAFDQTLQPSGLTAANPHIGVDNTYLVRSDAPFQKVADVDAPGVRISVAEGSSGDIYLGRTLRYATLVRTPATPQALNLLGTGQVDAFAGGRGPQVIAFSACCGGRLLPDNFLIANLATVVPDTAARHSGAGLQYINEFVDWAKTSGLVQAAIDRAQQGGTHVTPPLPASQRIGFLRGHVARLVENGALNHGHGHALDVKLEGALRKLADGDTEPAMRKLGAFINQVAAFRAAGMLSEKESASLLVIARDVVTHSAQGALAGGSRSAARYCSHCAFNSVIKATNPWSFRMPSRSGSVAKQG